MPELRWILIALGVVFIAGLWLWETRRARLASEEQDEPAAPDRTEPSIDAASDFRPTAAEVPVPPIRAIRRERVGPPDPPVVEIPAGVEPEIAREPLRKPELPMHVSYQDEPEDLGELPADLAHAAHPPADDYTRREPWVRTQPLDREELRKAQEDEEAERAAAEAEQSEVEANGAAVARQRIVALRLVAARDRWPGRSVIEALTGEGLALGKYSIYHREREDGKSIYYVASMVEPGSFDIDRIDSQTYPGISVFAVFPGPVDGATTFDRMLATARRLADKLQGHLQDEQGSTLTAQRILSLREEIVHFEHLTRRLRGG